VKTGIKTLRENWGSNLGFIMATTVSAVGLGNLWNSLKYNAPIRRRVFMHFNRLDPDIIFKEK
jgi:hypothetical protein